MPGLVGRHVTAEHQGLGAAADPGAQRAHHTSSGPGRGAARSGSRRARARRARTRAPAPPSVLLTRFLNQIGSGTVSPIPLKTEANWIGFSSGRSGGPSACCARSRSSRRSRWSVALLCLVALLALLDGALARHRSGPRSRRSDHRLPRPARLRGRRPDRPVARRPDHTAIVVTLAGVGLVSTRWTGGWRGVPTPRRRSAPASTWRSTRS